jgi:hypothetical protein
MGLAMSQDESSARKSDPPDLRIPAHFFFHEWPYMEPHRQTGTERAFKRRVYDTLRTMPTAETKPRELRMVQLQPLVWDNLHSVILPDGTRSARCMVIHDIILTNVMSHRIRLKDNENCTHCER